MGGTGYSGSVLPGISNPLPGNNENFIYYTTGTASNSGQLSTRGTVLLLAALSPPPPPPPRPPPPPPTLHPPHPNPTTPNRKQVAVDKRSKVIILPGGTRTCKTKTSIK